MKRIRGGSGLGDAVYLRPIVEHFIRNGEEVTVCSDYPDVFIGSGAKVQPFDRFNIDVLAHYTAGKRFPDSNQWQDICRSAKVDVELSFKWSVRNQSLIDQLLEDADGRPLVMVHGGRVPMGRTDGFGAELLPKREAFELVLKELSHCFKVRVGKGSDLYELPVDVDMNGGTSVSDLLDIGSACDGIVGQCSFAIPIAEAFGKPLLIVWSAEGMNARHPYISSITPSKVLSKDSSVFVIDNWSEQNIKGSAASFGWSLKQEPCVS